MQEPTSTKRNQIVILDMNLTPPVTLSRAKHTRQNTNYIFRILPSQTIYRSLDVPPVQ